MSEASDGVPDEASSSGGGDPGGGGRLLGLLAGVRRRLEGLSLPALLALGGLVMVLVSTGGYYAYQTYDWVEHDNDFCLSCHLMVEPYEEFARSAHRGLGCKACHQPTLMQRSSMALTQILENPDSLAIHAEVPNGVCADCHIEGNPEQWALVANTAGHRVHLESEDSALAGLQCVECHSTSVHEFASSDRTCAQSGCHTDSDVVLGAMGDFTIHCAACHGFSTPVEPVEDQASALAALAPERDTCLSCHAMRTLVELPEPDPHESACAACHNPHTQETPAAAVESCATAGCHTEPDTLSAMHRGLESGVMEDCSSCHEAHDFSVQSDNCLACHQDIFEDGGPVTVASAATDGWWVHLQEAAPDDFRHAEHREVDCASCHSSAETHGALTVTTQGDCRSCHHTEPVATDCAACHAETASDAALHPATRRLELSVGTVGPRELPFRHEDHADAACSSCHTEAAGGLALDASGVDCASCHEEHHEPQAGCIACHAQAPVEDHPPEEVHLTCSGSGCHTDLPFPEIPRSRDACLTCHQDLQEHRPERPCAECHALDGTDPAGP